MKKLTLFVEDDVIDTWIRELHFLKLAEEHMDEEEYKEMLLSSGVVSIQLKEKILDYLDRKEKILHLITEVH